MNKAIASLIKCFVTLNLIFLFCFIIDAVGNPEGENLIDKALNSYLVPIVETIITIFSVLYALSKKR